ncbi:MAG: DUF2935 domain-containing protein [Firmicutes bacterium]|nr:DUF2935 domain-containing protein [Bacillota bacterium]
MNDFLAERRELVGALEEKRFFDRIMYEHAQFMRAGVDPTEEAAFREADRFAVVIRELWERVMATPATASDEKIEALIRENLRVITPFQEFEADAAAAIAACRLLAITPADLVRHLAVETVFFLGILKRVEGLPTPFRSELELPNGNKRALLYPRLSFVDHRNMLGTLAFEYGMFWTQRHMEHAAVLALFFRPGIQEEYTRLMLRYEKKFQEVLDLGKMVFARDGVIDTRGEDRDHHPLTPAIVNWINEVIAVTKEFRDVMAAIVRQQVSCTIPSGQANFWPLLGDHIRREADYLIDAMHRILAATGQPPRSDHFPHPRPYETDWRDR